MDEGSQLTQVRSNVDLPGGAIKRPGLGESSKPYKEEAAVERVKELSMRASQEEDKEKEDEELDLVLGELVKIINDSEDEIHVTGRDTLYNATIRQSCQPEYDVGGGVEPVCVEVRLRVE